MSGLRFGEFLVYGGNVQRDIDDAAEQGPDLGARAVRFTADSGNGGTIYYKGGSNAADLATGSGDSADTGVPLAAGESSDWLPGNADDYYFLGSAINQNLHIEYLL